MKKFYQLPVGHKLMQYDNIAVKPFTTFPRLTGDNKYVQKNIRSNLLIKHLQGVNFLSARS